MKAWNVRDEDEGIGSIVFAATRGKAKSLGCQAPGLDGCDWVNISATRIPSLDGVMKEACILDWQKHKHIYWNARWFSDPDDMGCCDDCGRYHYEDIPESFIDDNNICRDCKNHPITTNKGD